jgi:hypothetical protein
MFFILFYIWNTISGIRAPFSVENCGLIFFQGRDIFRRLEAIEIYHYENKPLVRESYMQEIQEVAKSTSIGHPCNPYWYPFEWYHIIKNLYTNQPRSPKALHI